MSETEGTQPAGTPTADTKTCRYPGCSREPEPAKGPGRPPQFCDDPGHNKTTAFHERRRRAKETAAAAGQVTNDDPSRPVDYSATRTRELLPIVKRLAVELRGSFAEVVAQLETLTDPGAAAVEMETAQAAADETVAKAVAAQRTAVKERNEAIAQREEADEIAEEAQARAERVKTEAAQQVEEANTAAQEARDAAARQVEEIQAETTRRVEEAQAEAARVKTEAAQQVEEANTAAQEARDESARKIAVADGKRVTAEAETVRQKAAADAAQADRNRLIKEHGEDRTRWTKTLEEERDEFRTQLAAATKRATEAYGEADKLRRELAAAVWPPVEEEPPADEATAPEPKAGRRGSRATAAKS